MMSQGASVISISPEIMSGVPVFAGTRVPIATLLDYLKAGESVDGFLEGFPSVKREAVVSLLEEAGRRLLTDAA